MWGAQKRSKTRLKNTPCKNAFKKHPLQNRTNVQIKGGGGVKGLLNNVKKTALFSRDGFPYLDFKVKFFNKCQKSKIKINNAAHFRTTPPVPHTGPLTDHLTHH